MPLKTRNSISSRDDGTGHRRSFHRYSITSLTECPDENEPSSFNDSSESLTLLNIATMSSGDSSSLEHSSMGLSMHWGDESFLSRNNITRTVLNINRSMTQAKSFLKGDDSQPIFFGHDDDGLDSELRGLSKAQRQLQNEMVNLNVSHQNEKGPQGNDSQMLNIDHFKNLQYNNSFRSQSSDISYLPSGSMKTQVDRDEPIMSALDFTKQDSADKESTPASQEGQEVIFRGVSNEASDTLPTNSEGVDGIAGPNDNHQVTFPEDDEVSINLDYLFMAGQPFDRETPPKVSESNNNKKSTAQEDFIDDSSRQPQETRVESLSSQRTDPGPFLSLTVDVPSLQIKLTERNEGQDDSFGETRTMADKIASTMFGCHEYEIIPLWKVKKANSETLTRIYEGTVLVYLASWVAVGCLHGTISHAHFWTLALIMPVVLTSLEIKLPHTVDEIIIALGILSCRFVAERILEKL